MMTKQSGSGPGGDAPATQPTQPTQPAGAQKQQQASPLTQPQPQAKTKPGGPEQT